LLGGCGERLDRDEATALIERVGPLRVRDAAESLRHFRAGREKDVPQQAWPPAIRELQPKSVVVENSGVLVWKTSRFVDGEAIYIVFERAETPAEGPGDPSVSRLHDRIYLYEFVG
jgi:hypothetical protein